MRKESSRGTYWMSYDNVLFARIWGSLLILYTAYLKASSLGESCREKYLNYYCSTTFFRYLVIHCIGHLLILGEDGPNPDQSGQTAGCLEQQQQQAGGAQRQPGGPHHCHHCHGDHCAQVTLAIVSTTLSETSNSR